MHSDDSVQALPGGYKVGDTVYSLVSRLNFDLDSDSDSEDAPPNVVPGSKGKVTGPALLSHYDEPNQATDVGVRFELGGSTDMTIKNITKTPPQACYYGHLECKWGTCSRQCHSKMKLDIRACTLR